MKYSFKEGEVLTIKAKDKADPQKIGKALETITANAGGRLMPADVVRAARDHKNVLHKHFEWDNELAAEQHRLDQARSLIRSIHVENVEAPSGYARGFLSVRDESGVSYRTVTEVLGSADLQRSVLEQAERDLIAFETRYLALVDICEMVSQVRAKISQRRKSKHESRVNV
jgi:hypothetical protein